MTKEEMQAIRAWLKQCPSQKCKATAAVAITLITALLVYRCGEAIGTFLYHVTH